MGIKSFFVKPSTAAFFKEARSLRNFSLLDFLHGYVYGRWTHLYIALGTGQHPLARKLAPLAAWLEKQITSNRVAQDSPDTISLAVHELAGKTIDIETPSDLAKAIQEVRARVGTAAAER